MLVKFVRYVHDFHKLVGCVVAICVNGEIRIGWSQCRLNEPFDKPFAKELALGRAYLGHKGYPCPYKTYKPDGTVIPVNVIVQEVASMHTRAAAYFKGELIINPVAVDELFKVTND